MKPNSSILCLLSFLAVSSLFADVPVEVNYTGHLTGEDGRELDAKVMLMAFRLYDRPGTGLTAEKATALWGRQSSVTLSGGDFDVNLKDSFGTQLANTRYVSLADAIAAALQEGDGGLYLGHAHDLAIDHLDEVILNLVVDLDVDVHGVFLLQLQGGGALVTTPGRGRPGHIPRRARLPCRRPCVAASRTTRPLHLC